MPHSLLERMMSQRLENVMKCDEGLMSQSSHQEKRTLISKNPSVDAIKTHREEERLHKTGTCTCKSYYHIQQGREKAR